MFYTRFYQLEDVRKIMAENLAEEERFKALPRIGHAPHDHTELILRFCRAAGLTDEEVRNMKASGVVGAFALLLQHGRDRTSGGRAGDAEHAGRSDAGTDRRGSAPAFEKHYGFKRTAREIEFFTVHDSADVEPSPPTK